MPALCSRLAVGSRRARSRWFAAAMLGLVAFLAPPERGRASTDPAKVLTIEIKGPIGVGTTAFIVRVLEQAREEQAGLVVLKLDTPGGLVASTRDIIQSILASPVPVAVWVAPQGARAASAGTYIIYAAHVAAMAPATNLGAATPVRIGAPGLPDGERDRGRDGKGDRSNEPRDDAGAMDRKVMNDAVAFIRSLAQLRGRNADWAERAVREAATLTAEEALKERVIDAMAGDLAALLAAIDGRTVKVAEAERRLATRGAPVVEVAPDWRTRIISTITDPTVAYLLLLIGIYGIIFEFFSPGYVLPGVIGGVCLLLALAALAVLPVDYAGLALILLGVAFMAAEAFTPGIGALGIGGLLALIAGSIFLFDPQGADIRIQVGWPAIATAAAASAAFLGVALRLALKARRGAVVTGIEQLIGSRAVVTDWQDTEGHVRAVGEIWRARGEAALGPGDTVRVRRVEGLTLVVERAPPG